MEKLNKEEKNKKHISKSKIAEKIMVSIIIIFMLFSVCGTLIYYLIQG